MTILRLKIDWYKKCFISPFLNLVFLVSPCLPIFVVDSFSLFVLLFINIRAWNDKICKIDLGTRAKVQSFGYMSWLRFKEWSKSVECPHWENNVSLLFCAPSVKTIRWTSGEMSKPSWRNRGKERDGEGVREGDEQTFTRMNNYLGFT